MPSNYNPDKYKAIFESRYGAGSYDAGLSNARSIGASKAQVNIAKEEYNKRLQEYKEKKEKKTYQDALNYWSDPSNNSALKRNGANRTAEEIKNDPMLQMQIKEQGFTIDDYINAMYNAASNGQFRSEREFNKYTEKLNKQVKAKENNVYSKYGIEIPIAQKKEQKKGDLGVLKKKNDNKSKKDKSNGSLLNDIMTPLKNFGQAINPFDDVSFTEAFKNNVDDAVKTDRSKFTKESTRGLTRLANTATLGTLDQVYKKTNDGQRASQFTNEDRSLAGKITDFGYDALGYLIPGMGTYKAIRGTGLGLKPGSKGVDKLKQLAQEGAIAGGLIAGGEVGVREAFNPKDTNYIDNLKHVGLGVGLGAIADPALYGLGKGISKAVQTSLAPFAKGDVPTFGGSPSQNVIDSLQRSNTGRLNGQSNELFDKLASIRKSETNETALLRDIDQARPEIAAAVQEPSLNRLTPGKDFEPITSGAVNEVPMVRGTPIDRTPIDIDNPKEIVKQQIDSTGKREKSKWSFDKAYTAIVNDLHAVNKASKDLGGKGLKIDNDPHKLAQLARGVAGKAETYLNGGVFSDSGQKLEKSLKEIIKPVENNIDDFLAYTTSKRALDYDSKGLTAGIKPKDVEGINDYQLAEATIKQIEAESPDFKKHQEELVKYSQNLMKELKDSGYYTDDALKKIFKENPNYIPMNRVQEPRVRGFEPLTSPKMKFASQANPIKQRTGSTKPIINPIESIVKNTYVITNIAERNKVGVALYDLLKNAPENNMWGRITNVTKQDASIDNLSSVLDDATVQMNDGRTDAIDNLFKGEGNKVYVYKDGQKIEMELQDDLYKAMLSLDAQKQNFFINLMGVPAKTLRAGAVLSPDFGPVNIFRDQLSAFVNSKYGFIPFWDMAKGMKSVLKRDSDYWLWKQSGGANSVLSTLDREYLQADLRKMVKQSLGQKVKNNFGTPFKALDTFLQPLRKVSEITEEATRVGEFKKGLNKGATPKEAAFSSRDLIDFSRAGTVGRQYNQVTAFFNAAVQSMDKLARTFKERKVEATVKSLASITLPSIVAYYYNQDKDWYKEIPQRERDLFWHFEIGDQIYKLPKPFEAGIMFGTSFERMLDFMKTNDPKAFEGFGKTVREAFTPNWIPTAILPWIEVYGNKSMHFDSPIVPRREQDLLPEDQYGPYQSELSKDIGAAFKKSPRKLEHVFKGYTGGLGGYFLKGTDLGYKVAGKEKPELPDKGIADAPILNRFVVKNLEGNNQSVNDFYKRMDKLKRENLSAKKHNPDHENTETMKTINQLSKEISELQAAKRAVIEEPNMSGEEKADVIKQIDQLITQLAKAGNRIP
ncbi:LPD38 domain-containing protein [Cytobacillus sp.]|uniref:LPD38 domain-containing protein n=1 Tax=Cytobacillus sp. TaxID=2675269 RepID=UPI0028BE4E53|nr:LPD38 domain-containing protein [Cytobacillus sp.]